MAAIYARVSSEQQREANTIASQTASLIEFARKNDLEVPKEWVFEDDGYSGATLERPGLERIRDLAAEGQIQAVLAYSPDRLSRKYAYQILLIDNWPATESRRYLLRHHKEPVRKINCSCSFRG
jgi:site-specific DNA recombinase